MMFYRIRQFFCVHWFGPIVESSYEKGYGAIVANQQKQCIVTEETRMCSKCGYSDSRVLYTRAEGWL